MGHEQRAPGIAGSIINDTFFDAQFFADTEGTYQVELTVDDGEFSASDILTVTVTTPNDVPVANAGADQYVDVGDSVTLNGSNSYDPDTDPLTYSWSFASRPGGSSATLSGGSTPIPSFTADASGQYTIDLIVQDDGGNVSAADQVRVTAAEAGGSGGGGGCFGCIALTQHRLATGGSAGMPAVLLLPFLFVWARRR